MGYESDQNGFVDNSFRRPRSPRNGRNFEFRNSNVFADDFLQLPAHGIRNILAIFREWTPNYLVGSTAGHESSDRQRLAGTTSSCGSEV